MWNGKIRNSEVPRRLRLGSADYIFVQNINTCAQVRGGLPKSRLSLCHPPCHLPRQECTFGKCPCELPTPRRHSSPWAAFRSSGAWPHSISDPLQVWCSFCSQEDILKMRHNHSPPLELLPWLKILQRLPGCLIGLTNHTIIYFSISELFYLFIQ